MFRLSFVLACFLYNGYAVLEDVQYKEVSSCILTDDVFDSSIVNLHVKGKLECATVCAKHAECEAFRISQDKLCILHNRTLQSQTCSQYPVKEYKGYNDINAPCLNGGVYTGSSCKCFDGYIGTRCEKLMRACGEGQTSGYYPEGKHVYLVHPDGAPEPFLVRCRLMAWGGRTYLMYRKEGLVDFNRPWADYKSGFGDLMAEFWLGLDKIHYLTSSHYQQLIAEVTTRMPSDTYPYRQHYYVGFRVGNDSTGYAFDFDSHWSQSGDHALGDCLSAMKGKKFTTVDVDNDDDPGNCASVHEGAWWFTGCGDCNPTGPFIQPTSGYLLNIPNEVFWYPGIPTYSLTEVELFMIPP